MISVMSFWQHCQIAGKPLGASEASALDSQGLISRFRPEMKSRDKLEPLIPNIPSNREYGPANNRGYGKNSEDWVIRSKAPMDICWCEVQRL